MGVERCKLLNLSSIVFSVRDLLCNKEMLHMNGPCISQHSKEVQEVCWASLKFVWKVLAGCTIYCLRSKFKHNWKFIKLMLQCGHLSFILVF
jgi:hypothetical protein